MFTSIQAHPLPLPSLIRWSARISAAFLFVMWLVLAMLEGYRYSFVMPSAASFYQAAALAVVFTGYAVGWRKELVGGLLAIVGTALFMAVAYMTTGKVPQWESLWFAAPGVLYLLAWFRDSRSGESVRIR